MSNTTGKYMVSQGGPGGPFWSIVNTENGNVIIPTTSAVTITRIADALNMMDNVESGKWTLNKKPEATQ